MLRLAILPEGYITPKEERTVRDLLRKRLQLVQQNNMPYLINHSRCTLNLLSIQGLYTRHLNSRLSNNKLKQLTQEQLAEDFTDPNVCMAVSGNFVVMQCLTQQIRQIERSLKQQLTKKRRSLT